MSELSMIRAIRDGLREYADDFGESMREAQEEIDRVVPEAQERYSGDAEQVIWDLAECSDPELADNVITVTQRDYILDCL